MKAMGHADMKTTMIYVDGVKIDIQKAASAKRIEQKSEEPDHNFLELLDYRSIIADNWRESFKGIFMDPEFPTGKKDDQLKWFVRLNAVRNKVSHPSRAKVTREEFDAMVKLNGWLPGRIGMTPIHTGV